MVSPLVQVPVISGVVSEVMLSVAEIHVSVPLVISGAQGAFGATVSVVTKRFTGSSATPLAET